MKITLAVPEGKKVLPLLKKEIAAARNIKSDKTRAQVLKGLGAIQLARISDDAAAAYLYDAETEKLKVEPYYGLHFIYRCDREFATLPKKPKSKYLLVAMDANECTIGMLEGKKITVLWKGESNVPRKQGAGGQSKVRFQRNRELALKHWFTEIAEKLREFGE